MDSDIETNTFGDYGGKENPDPAKKHHAFGYDSLESVRKKLLDLTGRNQLINYKHPKSSCVRIIDELPDQIFEELQAGKVFTFVPVPEPTERELIEQGYLRWDDSGILVEEKPFPNAEQWARYLGLNTSYELPVSGVSTEQRHTDLDIQTLMYANELEARLRAIRGKAETAIEESGSNVLYIVLGFLEWYESRDSDIKRFAPLFTLPAKLERTRLDENMGVFRYTVSLKDEGLIGNITLREKLSNDFDVALPELNDDSSPEAYFRLLSRTVLKHEPRWKLHRMATLAILNFTKQVMYEDLNPSNWPAHKRIEGHPIIKQFFSSQAGSKEKDNSFEAEYAIDKIDNIHDEFPLIFEADSSQHSALIDAIKGENLVIEGPPGSGKSQTITNLIAASIANGKRVLFVAEKMAALEVVKRRLDKAGLGDFCLELHSHKTQKQRLLEDLNSRLNKQGKYPDPTEIEADIARFEDLKGKLNHYVKIINSTWKNTGLSIHKILNRATRYREQLGLNPDKYPIEKIGGDALTAVRSRELVDLGEMLKSIFHQIQEQSPGSNIAHHYWYGVNNAELISHQQEELCSILIKWNENLNALCYESKRLTEKYTIPEACLSELKQIESFSKNGADLPELIGGEPLSLLHEFSGCAKELESTLFEYDALYEDLEKFEGSLVPKAIESAKVPDVIEACLKKLRSLGLMAPVSIVEVQSTYEGILRADESAKLLVDPLLRIRENVPEKLQDLGLGSVSSVSELKTFLGLVKDLPSELWRHRDAVYDAPEMDDLLDQMTSRFNNLLPAHKSLQERFKLSELPAAESLANMHETLCDGGMLFFLKRSWWQERKRCFELAITTKPNIKELKSFLPGLIEYKRELESLDKINADSQVLNGLYKGMDTPLDRIVILREWYRSARTEYGRGLGPRAKYAEALFSMKRDLALALTDLAQDSFMNSLENIISSFNAMGKQFGGHEALTDTHSSLLGQNSPFRRMLVELHKSLVNLTQCFKSDVTTLAQCREIAVSLQSYQARASNWRKTNLVTKLKAANLPLEVGVGKKNKETLLVSRNFLSILVATENSEALNHAIKSKSAQGDYVDFKRTATSIYQLYEKTQEEWSLFSELGKVKQEEWFQICEGKIHSLIHRNREAIEHKKWLSNWLDYLRLRARLLNEGMKGILLAVERGDITSNLIVDVVNMVLMHQLSKEVLAENPFLSEFSGMEQMAIRERFCEYDKKLLELQRQKIAFRASKKQAPLGNASGKISSYTEVSLIRHEAGKKRAHVAVRTLIDRSGTAIQALKPCFMMSPMSVAQYLKPGMFEFDMVVMDEASQIRPEEALGAIARGESLVVVGDPKQLPPTSFFEKILNDEPDDDTVALEESESILNSAEPMFKTRRLRWHYRSRHESLIAFSNLHYYNSDLVVFPSPYATGSEFGIRYSRIKKGRFARGKNAEEARAIAQMALQHMVERPKESLGLVAMNSEQRIEIEMHIEQLVKDSAEFKDAFDKNSIGEEPLFIKNLENVQGDERDVIMISMTYGPDEVGGRVFQRFGPINKDVGWRRLNVLFTRSKKRMHIFSSMDSHDIQLSGSSKKGVQSLRKFLEYCESGHLMSAVITGREADSDFEISVKNALADRGYECEPQLGVAGYYLDLAVKDPDYPGSYLLGVECDGATYHSAKSARDRDRLRQEILESLGWKIKRIWSTDWFKNPDAQLQPILNELEKLTEGREIELEVEDDAVEFIETSEDLQPLEAEFDAATSDGEKTLHSILTEFDLNIIRKQCGSTDPNKRLLRPAMLEAFNHELPTSKEEFAFKIPHYLRAATDKEEAKHFLDDVLEIIGDYG